MKYSKFLIGAVAVVALALTAAAFTRGHHRGHGGFDDHDMTMNDDGRGGGGFRGDDRLATTLDANGNHVISDETVASMADRAFQRQDQNRDDALTLDEYTFKPSRWFNSVTPTTAQIDSIKKRFAETDTDKSNLVSKLEFMTAEHARYLAADADKDGKISAWEFHSITRPFS